MAIRFWLHTFFIRLLHWEYWSFNAIYGPIYIFWFWYALKARSVFFFNTSNPLIQHGGFLMESKKAIYDLMPAEYYPKSLLFSAGTTEETVLKSMKDACMHYPLIMKPDIGMRGLEVGKVESDDDVRAYLKNCRVDFLVQDFVKLEKEVGIFYCRMPGDKNGIITGIVAKEFLSVTGNGIHTIEQLLSQNSRFVLQLPVLRLTMSDRMSEIPDKGANVLLVPYGNHARGARFLDISDRADPELTAAIDILCKNIPEFYFGRIDLRYQSLEDLKKLKNFSIIELNGAGSEPTHIYDPRHSLFFAWKEIIRHWSLLCSVSMKNHQQLNLPYMTFKEGWRMLRANSAYVKKIGG